MFKNTLKSSHSAYLLRHSENPVHWQKWEDDAFLLAKKLKRPVFLSSGYDSCHWCKVMEKESFSDESIANILNNNFVPIKLDIAEYPDVDKEYQFYLQSSGEAGGWPLSIFLDNDKSPFYAGRYYDKASFEKVLLSIIDIYNNKYNEIQKVIATRNEFMSIFYRPSGLPIPSDEEAKAFRLNEFKKIFDMENGGLRDGAKFPTIPSLLYLIDYINEDAGVSNFLKLTADKLSTSAIYDHVHGGFFRYTTDRKWLYPHFEKMLSDNALNSLFLLKMYEETENLLYLTVAKNAIDFVVENLMTDFGLTYSIDADSKNNEGVLSEGYFYKVSDRDFSNLSENELRNFPNEARLENNIISLKYPEYIKVMAMQPTLEKISSRVLATKQAPTTSNFVVSADNFLFCSTLLKAFEVTGEDWYLNLALSLYNKMRHLIADENTIFRGNYKGELFNHTTLIDHVYYLQASIEFYTITKEKDFLMLARGAVDEIETKFMSNGIPCLDVAHNIKDTFDDDKANPISLYLNILVQYKAFLNTDIHNEFIDYAIDRAARFPTGNATIIQGLNKLNR